MSSALKTESVAKPPSWSFETLKPFDERRFLELSPFAVAEHWCDSESINVYSVIGTRNSSYFGWSWLDLLQNGKRMDSINLPLFEQNPGYYDEQTRKIPSMTFISMDGYKLFVDTDGNHRTCVARFAFARDGRTQLSGVSVKRVEFDLRLFDAFGQIQDLIRRKALRCQVRPERKTTVREDGAGWKVDRYQPVLLLEEFGKGSVSEFTFDSAQAWLAANSKRTWFSGLWK